MTTRTDGPTSMQHNELRKTQPMGITVWSQNTRDKKEILRLPKREAGSYIRN